MPARAIALSRTVGHLLREQRRRLGYTLRDVERLTAQGGNPIPFSTLARIEQGRLDPGLKRLHALLRLYGLPIQAAGDLLDVESIAGDVAAQGDIATLRDRGEKAWRSGDLPTAFACYLAMRHHEAEREPDRALRHESILSFAVMAAKLGKHHIARQMLDELSLDKPDRPMLIRILVQSASTWQALGSADLAFAQIAGAEALLAPGDHRGRGWVAHMRATLRIDTGAFDQARADLVAAARLYQRANRPYDRALALVVMARLEVEAGDAARARRAAVRAARFASRHDFERVHALASIQEARAFLLSSDPARAIAVLDRLLAATVTTPDNVIRFYVHFYLSKAYTAAGEPLRARAELTQARYFVRFVDQASRETSEVRGHLEGGSSTSSP